MVFEILERLKINNTIKVDKLTFFIKLIIKEDFIILKIIRRKN